MATFCSWRVQLDENHMFCLKVGEGARECDRCVRGFEAHWRGCRTRFKNEKGGRSASEMLIGNGVVVHHTGRCRSLCVVLTINQRLRRCAAVNADAFHNTDLHNAADDFFISRRSNR